MDLKIAKDIQESLSAKAIGKTRSQFNGKAYIDVKLPFSILDSLKEVL